jgi:hypothetical protein
MARRQWIAKDWPALPAVALSLHGKLIARAI